MNFYVASEVMIANDELERIWKETLLSYFNLSRTVVVLFIVTTLSQLQTFNAVELYGKMVQNVGWLRTGKEAVVVYCSIFLQKLRFWALAIVWCL
jgi:hypothetical protein